MSKRNLYVLYTTGELYDPKKVHGDDSDLVSRPIYSVIGMYANVDDALRKLNVLNEESMADTKQHIWYIKRETEFRKLMTNK